MSGHKVEEIKERILYYRTFQRTGIASTMWIVALVCVLSLAQGLTYDAPCKITDGIIAHAITSTILSVFTGIYANIFPTSGNGTVVLDNSNLCPQADNCTYTVEMRKHVGNELAFTLFFCSSAQDIADCAEDIVSTK